MIDHQIIVPLMSLRATCPITSVPGRLFDSFIDNVRNVVSMRLVFSDSPSAAMRMSSLLDLAKAT